jgi:hypothetical protein
LILILLVYKLVIMLGGCHSWSEPPPPPEA